MNDNRKGELIIYYKWLAFLFSLWVNVSSIGLKGLEGYRVQVEVQISKGTESMVIVGLPDASVKKSKERVLSAIRTLECDVTDQKIVVNLSPSERKRQTIYTFYSKPVHAIL